MGDRFERIVITDVPVRAEGHGEDPEHGAVVTFSGVVRNHNEGRPVAGIFYDCYREMALREMERIVEEVESESPVRVVSLVHRVGEIKPGETSLLAVVSSAHRREAFDAVQALVTRIKERVPIWKKERYADDSSAWL